MNLKSKVEDWKKYPNALGSESQVAVIIGSICAQLGEDIPSEINIALKVLSLRGTMRDIASAIEQNREHRQRTEAPSFHDVVDSGATASGLSWCESLAIISKYLDQQVVKLG